MAAKKETRGSGKGVKKLKLKKETLKDLGVSKARDVKGGILPRGKTQACGSLVVCGTLVGCP